MKTINEKLKTEYIKEVSKFDSCLFDKKNTLYDKLSGLFVSSCPASWCAGSRILVVGRETKAWNVLSHAETYIDLPDYESVLSASRVVIYLNISAKKKTEDRRFSTF